MDDLINNFDAINAHFEQIHRRETERLLNGQCRHCGGTFLFGTEKNAECINGSDFFYLCFWCMDETERDPYTGEFEPSMYHYGKA